MKKTLATLLLIICSYTAATACSIARFRSGCIKQNFDGSQTITAIFDNLCITSPSTIHLYIHTGPGNTPADYLHITSSTSIVYYITQGTYTFHIPPASAVPLNHCLEIYSGDGGTNVPWMAWPAPVYSQLCPCATSACYVNYPDPSSLTVKVNTPAAGPTPLYLWLDDGLTPSWTWTSPFSSTSPGIFNGIDYEHTITCPGYSSLTISGCITAYTSDVYSDPLMAVTPYDPTDPSNADAWATRHTPVCKCQARQPSNYRPGCISMDPVTYYQSVTVETDNPGPNFMWYESISYGYATQLGPAVLNPAWPATPGALQWIVTFDFSTIAGGISISGGCHNFYFSNTLTGAKTRILICPCDAQPPAEPKYQPGCIQYVEETGEQTVIVETNNGSTPNYMWYETVPGMAYQLGAAILNPAWPTTPGSLQWLVTFDFSTIGGGIGIPGGCHNFYFSINPTDPRPAGAVVICPCGSEGPSGKGNSGTNIDPGNGDAGKVSVYPNPASDEVTVQFNVPYESEVLIEITDQVGRIVTNVANRKMEAGTQKINVGIQGMTPGIYFVKVKTADALVIKPLTVTK